MGSLEASLALGTEIFSALSETVADFLVFFSAAVEVFLTLRTGDLSEFSDGSAFRGLTSGLASEFLLLSLVVAAAAASDGVVFLGRNAKRLFFRVFEIINLGH